MNSNPLDNPDHLRRAALVVGIIALIVGCRMSYKFGSSMSFEHGISLALLAIAGCIILPAAGIFNSKIWRNVGLLFLAIEFFSHIGYSVGTRVMNTEQTDVHNVAYDVKQKSVERNASLLEGMKRDLAAMQAQNAWAATVSADGLRAQITPMDLAIAQETARGGCGPKCLKLTQDKAAIEDKIAVVEKVDNLNKQIATMQLLVNAKETEATTAEFVSSPVVAQTKFVSQLATLELEPGAGALTWTQIFIGFFIALATTFLSPTMFSVAFGAVKVPSFAPKAPVANAPYSTVDAQVAALRDAFEKMQRRSQEPVKTPATVIEKHTHEIVEKNDPRIQALADAVAQGAPALMKLRAA